MTEADKSNSTRIHNKKDYEQKLETFLNQENSTILKNDPYEHLK